MKHRERAAIFRLLSDTIRSDNNISTRDIQQLNMFAQKYKIQHTEDITLESAINLLKNTSEIQRWIDGLNKMATSQERRKFLAAIKIATCSELSSNSAIYSVENTDCDMIPCHQILYLEGEYDVTTNKEIIENYRYITNEFSLIGQHFVYLPMLVKQLNAIDHFDDFLTYLYPQTNKIRAKKALCNLLSVNTADFCRSVINNKLHIEQLQYCSPSLIMPIGFSAISQKRIDNYLVINLNNNILYSIKTLCDICRPLLSPIAASQDIIIFNGFYKLLLNNQIERDCVTSRVCIDFRQNSIFLPDANVKLSFMHRREKALYLLFMLESQTGGINFNKARTAKSLDSYKRRMKNLKRKYNLIYKELGGTIEHSPNIELPEIRLPMISIIKRGFLQLGDTLNEVDNYIIKRNIFGNYVINLPSNMFVYFDDNSLQYKEISKHPIWKKLRKL